MRWLITPFPPEVGILVWGIFCGVCLWRGPLWLSIYAAFFCGYNMHRWCGDSDQLSGDA